MALMANSLATFCSWQLRQSYHDLEYFPRAHKRIVSAQIWSRKRKSSLISRK
jgi:hypothetical protein